MDRLWADLSYFRTNHWYYLTYDNSKVKLKTFPVAMLILSVSRTSLSYSEESGQLGDLELDVWKNCNWKIDLENAYGTNSL